MNNTNDTNTLKPEPQKEATLMDTLNTHSKLFPSEKTAEMRDHEIIVYGPDLAALFDKAGIDAQAVTAEVQTTNAIPKKVLKALKKHGGFSKCVVEAFFIGVAAGKREVVKAQVQPDIDEVKGSVGGHDEYAKMIVWLLKNLDPQEVAAFGVEISQGKESTLVAVKAMHDRYKSEVTE
jgi:hypothetical protein